MTQPIESGHLAGGKSEPTARERKSSPLPWTLDFHRTGSIGSIDDANGVPVAQAFQVLPMREDQKQLTRNANAAMIVEAVNAHAALVARVEKLEGARHSVIDAVEEEALRLFCGRKPESDYMLGMERGMDKALDIFRAELAKP